MIALQYCISFCCQFSSIAQSRPTLQHMDCSTTGFPILHRLLELAQTQVHLSQWCHPAILSSVIPFTSWLQSLPASGSFPRRRVSSSHLAAKALELQLQLQSFQWIFRIDFLKDWLVWSPCSSRDSQESSPAPPFESISSSALSLPYGPTLTSIHDCWKNHRFDCIDLCQQSNVSAF